MPDGQARTLGSPATTRHAARPGNLRLVADAEIHEPITVTLVDASPGQSERPIDLAAFARDLAALRGELDAALGPEDVAHLTKMARWGRWCTALGYATAWMFPNPISALLLAHGSTVRWTVVMHHVGHGAYDRVPGAAPRHHSRRFAVGARRWLDWLDWISPQAWRFEHNRVHHPHLGGPDDPDLVQRNIDWLRRADLPRIIKLAVVGFFACTWKLVYYAASVFQVHRRGLAHGDPGELRYLDAFDLRTAMGREFWRTCVLPHALVRFVVIPLLFTPLGASAVLGVLLTGVIAELLTNIQTFVLITPNHAGDDLPTFSDRPASRAEFQWRQIAGTVNYSTRGDLVAFLHGWLNYHIEHHLWPDLPVLKYRQAQARLQALCARHGVPYRQEGALRRARRAIAVMIGEATMRPAVTPAGSRAPATPRACPRRQAAGSAPS